MNMTHIGRMRHRITLQQEARTADTGGGATLGWDDVATLWAEITPVSGSEVRQADQLVGSITHRIHVRYMGTITTAMRFMMGTRVFNIRSIKNMDERGRMMDILAEEGVAT